MATQSIDYFSRDFDSIRDDLVGLIQYYTPEWTDRNASDLGIVIIELFAYAGDVLHFYLDRRAQDLYLPTAFTRQSVVNLLKLIDFNVPGKSAATADVQFTITDAPYDEAIEIPALLKLEAPAGTGSEPVRFETLVPTTFGYTTLTAPAANPSTQITVSSSINFFAGQTINLRDDVTPDGELLVIEEVPDSSTIKVATQILGSYTTVNNARISVMVGLIGVQQGVSYEDTLGQSDGTAWQTFTIARENVINGSITVSVDETGSPELWAEVDSLAYAAPNEKVFELSTNFEGYVTIRFGDGLQGKIPSSGSDIISLERVGGGQEGNVGSGTITKILDDVTSTLGAVNFSVTNPEESSGGAEEMSIEDAKFYGPKALRALYRCVTLNDYSVLARNITGIDESKAVRRGSPLFREIDVYIIPNGSYTPTATLIEQVREYLQARSMAGETVYVQGPKHVVGVLLTAEVVVLDSYDRDDVQRSVEVAIDNFFAVGAEGAQFGKNVNLSDVMALIDNIPGVDYVNVDQLTSNPADTLEWIIAPDSPATVDYIIGLNNSDLIDQTYTITFESPTTYRVRDANSISRGVGTLGVELQLTGPSGAGSPLKMKLSLGDDAMAANDRAEFRTSEYAKNVEIADFEIRSLDTLTLSFVSGSAL